MGVVHEKRDLRDKFYVFIDREHAGRELAKFLKERLTVRENLLVLAIPAGGVPVGCIVARELGADLDLICVRKLPIPWDPEAGFGALTPDGEIVLDPLLVRHLGLTDEVITQIAERVLVEVKRREMVFRGGRPEPVVEGRNVILVDDGLATGLTMLAAIRWVKKRRPTRVFVATPTASESAVARISCHVDALFVLNVRREMPYFAVADAYQEWRDLTDKDVIQYLKKYGFL